MNYCRVQQPWIGSTSLCYCLEESVSDVSAQVDNIRFCFAKSHSPWALSLLLPKKSVVSTLLCQEQLAIKNIYMWKIWYARSIGGAQGRLVAKVRLVSKRRWCLMKAHFDIHKLLSPSEVSDEPKWLFCNMGLCQRLPGCRAKKKWKIVGFSTAAALLLF